jgi:predicted Zn-dependent peptidase
VRTQTLTAIAQAQKSPSGIAGRALPAVLYGENHPYATTAIGNPEAVQSFTRADIAGFHQSWLRPETLDLFVVSNLPLAEVRSELDRAFGDWAPPAAPKGVKAFPALPQRPNSQRIILIDRPDSPQSVILGAQLTPIDPRGDVIPVTAANDVLGGNFLARINTDLRETKGWTYGSYGFLTMTQNAVPYIIQAPVQADRTGDSIKALQRQVTGFLGQDGVTKEELERVIAKGVSQLPGQFETSGAVLNAMQTNLLYGRPDNYYELLADRYRGQTQASLDQALRDVLDPNGFVWVVVGDASKIRPQLEKLKLPIEMMEPR